MYPESKLNKPSHNIFQENDSQGTASHLTSVRPTTQTAQETWALIFFFTKLFPRLQSLISPRPQQAISFSPSLLSSLFFSKGPRQSQSCVLVHIYFLTPHFFVSLFQLSRFYFYFHIMIYLYLSKTFTYYDLFSSIKDCNPLFGKVSI